MEALQQLLQQQLLRGAPPSEAFGRLLDVCWSRLTAVNGRFFGQGWGNLGIVNLAEDINHIKQWPPADMQIDWRLLQTGVWEGTPYRLLEGAFRTPCVERIHDALPAESRTGRVQLLLPDGPPGSGGGGSGGSMITARLPLGGRSIGRLRRTTASSDSSSSDSSSSSSSRVLPAAAFAAGDGSSLFGSGRHVSAALLHLAATGDQGFGRRLRLGGPLLAEGVAQLVLESPFYGARRPEGQRGSKLCAVSDLLALGWATIYESLCLLHWLEAAGVSQRGICGLSMGGVHAAMTAGLCPRPLAATPLLTPRSAAVAYCDGALAPLMAWGSLLARRDGADNDVEEVVAGACGPVSLLAGARYVSLQHSLEVRLDAAGASLQDARSRHGRHHDHQQHHQQQQPAGQQHQQQQAQDDDAVGRAEEAVAAVQHVAALAAAAEAAAAEAAVSFHHQQQQQQDAGGIPPGGQQPQEDKQQQPRSWRRQIWRWTKHVDQSSSSSSSSTRASPQRWFERPPPPPDTFRRLRHVLETYTDVTRYPVPVRPDAAVLVAARNDEYVSTASVRALQEHWPGSELRLVSGGHVSAFLLHQDAFRSAMRDSLARLTRGPSTTPDAAASGMPRQHAEER